MGVLGRYDDAQDRVLPAGAWRYDDSDSASQSGESQDEHLATDFFEFSSTSQISVWG